MQNACCFFGHRDAEPFLEEIDKLKNLILDLIENRETTIFYFGGFGNFDQLCWQIVTEIKFSSHPEIQRLYCLEDERYLRASKRPKYLKSEDYEDFVYFLPENNYWVYRVFFRNREIIKHSDYCVFYVRRKEDSGAYKAYQFAQKNNKCYFLI